MNSYYEPLMIQIPEQDLRNCAERNRSGKTCNQQNKRKDTMSETPRTDVGVNYWINTGEITELRDISEEIEQELFRTNNLIKDCLAAMPVGYIPTHTPENLPSMIGDLAKELAEETQNSEKLEKELALMTQQRDALIAFLECEMNWMFFRAEYQLGENPTQHQLNGNKIREYLQAKGWEPR